MAKMKTEFELQVPKNDSVKASVKIVNYGGVSSYILVDQHTLMPYKQGLNFELRGKSLETFAVNILKAIGSKKFKK